MDGCHDVNLLHPIAIFVAILLPDFDFWYSFYYYFFVICIYICIFGKKCSYCCLFFSLALMVLLLIVRFFNHYFVVIHFEVAPFSRGSLRSSLYVMFLPCFSPFSCV